MNKELYFPHCILIHCIYMERLYTSAFNWSHFEATACLVSSGSRYHTRRLHAWQDFFPQFSLTTSTRFLAVLRCSPWTGKRQIHSNPWELRLKQRRQRRHARADDPHCDRMQLTDTRCILYPEYTYSRYSLWNRRMEVYQLSSWDNTRGEAWLQRHSKERWKSWEHQMRGMV